MMTLREQILKISHTYEAAPNRIRGHVSTIVFNGGHVLKRIENGGDISTGTFERAMQWFSDHWPEGTPWPDDIARPEPKMVAAPPVAAPTPQTAEAAS